MKSTRRAARSRSGGYPLDTLRERVIAPIIYLGPLIVGAAPLLLLYWIYRPTVLPNPGLSALKAPPAMALLLPAGEPDFHEDVGTSNRTALADVAEDFDQPEPPAQKSKSSPATRDSQLTVGRRDLRFTGSARRSGPAHNVSTAVTNPGQYPGMGRSAASAYAYAGNQSGRYRW
jgi:hypothetical protein